MSTSLDQAKAARAARKAKGTGKSQLSDTGYLDPAADLERFTKAVEAEMPYGRFYQEAIESCPLNAAGDPSTIWAWRAERVKGQRPAQTVTVYASGKILYQGIPAVAF